MNTVEDVLKAKCEELTAEVKKQVDSVTNTGNSLKQLRAEKKLALAKIQEFNGALLAYTSTLNIMKATQAPIIAEAQATPAPVTIEGEVVPESNMAVLD